MIRVAIFHEYNGLPIPDYPSSEIKFEIDRGVPLKSRFFDLQKTNVKVFTKDENERKIVKELFISNGFVLVADHIFSRYKRSTGASYIVQKFDRLIFNSPPSKN